MKIRLGFVANSSSTAFVCNVCGTIESGMDMTLGDAGMVECQAGHVFCESHQIGYDDPEPEEEVEDEEEYDGYYDVNSKKCPICQFTILPNKDFIDFLRITTNTTPEKVLEKVRTMFDSYAEWQKYLKSNKDTNI